MILGHIGVRAGSKGVPGKNFRMICGKPLIQWSLDQLFANTRIDKVVVSTDSPEIYDHCVAQGTLPIGLRPGLLKAVFFVLLSASVVAAMQTVGAFLVIAMVVTPGATAYLLCDRFPRLILTSVAIGTLTSFFGAYASFFLDGATGGIIVVLQTLIFLAAFVLAPKHGLLAARRKAALALRQGPTLS